MRYSTYGLPALMSRSTTYIHVGSAVIFFLASQGLYISRLIVIVIPVMKYFSPQNVINEHTSNVSVLAVVVPFLLDSLLLLLP